MLLRATTSAKLFPYLHNCRPTRFNIKFVSQQASRDVRPRVGSTQEVFCSPVSNTRYVLAYVGAATQLIFWGNLAQWAGTAYVVKDKETGEYELATSTTRYFYAGWLAGMGIVFAYVFLFIPSRLVTRVSLIPQSKMLLVETPHPFMPFSKIRVTSAPISKFSLSSPVFTGQGRYGASALAGQFRYIALNIKGQRVGYALDREGRFHGSAKTKHIVGKMVVAACGVRIWPVAVWVKFPNLNKFV